jgi:3-isopropylmalate/(R)-2-methylmalate dehydratase small subunit
MARPRKSSKAAVVETAKTAAPAAFGGPILFIDRSDINTDEIIPAKYLNEIRRQDLGPHLFEDLKLDGFTTADIAGKRVVVSRANFGCGSSREHAPWALEVNGIRMVAAAGFARIFRQNMYNGGMLPVELEAAAIDDIFRSFASRPAEGRADLGAGTITITAASVSRSYPFTLSAFHRELIRVGGWVAYAAGKY